MIAISAVFFACICVIAGAGIGASVVMALWIKDLRDDQYVDDDDDDDGEDRPLIPFDKPKIGVN